MDSSKENRLIEELVSVVSGRVAGSVARFLLEEDVVKEDYSVTSEDIENVALDISKETTAILREWLQKHIGSEEDCEGEMVGENTMIVSAKAVDSYIESISECTCCETDNSDENICEEPENIEINTSQMPPVSSYATDDTDDTSKENPRECSCDIETFFKEEEQCANDIDDGSETDGESSNQDPGNEQGEECSSEEQPCEYIRGVELDPVTGNQVEVISTPSLGKMKRFTDAFMPIPVHKEGDGNASTEDGKQCESEPDHEKCDDRGAGQEGRSDRDIADVCNIKGDFHITSGGVTYNDFITKMINLPEGVLAAENRIFDNLERNYVPVSDLRQTIAMPPLDSKLKGAASHPDDEEEGIGDSDTEKEQGTDGTINKDNIIKELRLQVESKKLEFSEFIKNTRKH